MPDLSMFIPITKVDAAKRLVYGLATAEVEDRAGEICDYASTKPHYQKWSEEISRSTNGKSRGNLRAMHGPVAAGKVTAITFNDEAKQIEICAKVVDDGEWLKVTEGVYTGFSQGGSYARRWKDKSGLTRYTAIPTEISLVDLPCLPDAKFEMIKVDGTREWRSLGRGSDRYGRLSVLLDELEWLQAAVESEGEPDETNEMDRAAADELRGPLERMITILRALMPESQSGEKQANSSRKPLLAMAAGSVLPSRRRGLLSKEDAGAVNANQTRVQKLHDMSVELGAACETQKLAESSLEKRFDHLAATINDVLQRVKRIEEQPLPLPLAGQTRPVAKHEETGGYSSDGEIDALLSDPDALSVLAIKLAQRNGRAPVR
jgi:hypothetical protein